MKKILYLLIVLLVIGGGVMLANELLINGPVKTKLQTDPRNQGIALNAHYRNYVLPGALVLNITGITGSQSPLDVFRAVLQASQALKDKDFKEVFLACKGTNRFKLTGAYFKELGTTYDNQNPLYTVRTFPANVQNLDGTPAYGQPEGGLFGAFTAGVEQFTDLSQKWYANELFNGPR
jgi:hypothetical protein